MKNSNKNTAYTTYKKEEYRKNIHRKKINKFINKIT